MSTGVSSRISPANNSVVISPGLAQDHNASLNWVYPPRCFAAPPAAAVDV